MKLQFKGLLLLLFFWTLCLLGFLLYPKVSGGQMGYLEFPNFAGGLSANRTGMVEANQCLELSNFLFDGSELKVRGGYGKIANGFSGDAVDFIGLYRKSSGGSKLLVTSGGNLYIVNTVESDTDWTDNEYTGNFLGIDTVSVGDSNSYYFSDNDTVFEVFESYPLTKVKFDSTGKTTIERTVDYALSDTAIKLTAVLPKKVTGWRYSLIRSLGEVVYGQSFVDSFYLATSTGKLKYNDSAVTGSFTPNVYRLVADTVRLEYFWVNPTVQKCIGLVGLTLRNGNGGDSLCGLPVAFRNFMFSATMDDRIYCKVSLRSIGDSASLVANKSYHITLRVEHMDWCATPNKITLAGYAAIPDNDTVTPIFSFLKTEIEENSKITLTADSLIFRGTTGFYQYTILVDDSSGFTATQFQSGDWFACYGSSIINNDLSQTASVIGGYVDDSSRVLITHGLWTKTAVADSIRTNKAITLFRRKTLGSTDAGVIAATFWNDRLCVVRDSTPSQVDFSELFYPDSVSGYLVQVSADDGERITFLRDMYGALIIGKNSSLWKLTGVPGIDAFAQLSKASEGIGFIAPKSIIVRNGLMFGLARDGFYFYDFNSMVKISNQIDQFVQDSINWSRADQVTAAFFDDHYWVSYASRNSVTNDRTLVFSPSLQAWGTANMTFRSLLVDYGSVDSSIVYLGLADTGMVCRYGDDNDDNGTAITAIAKTSWFNMASGWYDKIINRVSLLNHRKSATSIAIDLFKDGATSASASRTLTGAQTGYQNLDKLWFTQDNTRGHEYQIKLTATTADSLRLGGLGVEYQIDNTDY